MFLLRTLHIYHILFCRFTYWLCCSTTSGITQNYD